MTTFAAPPKICITDHCVDRWRLRFDPRGDVNHYTNIKAAVLRARPPSKRFWRRWKRKRYEGVSVLVDGQTGAVFLVTLKPKVCRVITVMQLDVARGPQGGKTKWQGSTST
jgi:hypothetical protein